MRLVIEGTSYNNQVIDGRGRVLSGDDCLLVRSKKDSKGNWHVPENMIIRNFVIDQGSVRLIGLGGNGEAPLVRESSRCPNHTEYCQQVAPKNIIFENLRITSEVRLPFYVGPGCTHITLQDSILDGTSAATSIYLCCESAHNKILRNQLMTRNRREAIAVDGSAYNVISENTFHFVDYGGVFLYRNSGEGGTVRHQAPRHNEIIGNTFIYGSWRSKLKSLIWPAVWVGSRSHFIKYFIRFRNDDKGYAFGSSVDNNDRARYNVIRDNQPKNIRVRVWET